MAQNNVSNTYVRDFLKALGLIVGLFLLVFVAEPLLIWGALDVGFGMSLTLWQVALVYLAGISGPITFGALRAALADSEGQAGQPKRRWWRI